MNNKKWTSCLLIFTLLVSMLNINIAMAEEPTEKNTNDESILLNEQYKNPLYDDEDIDLTNKEESTNYISPRLYRSITPTFNTETEAGSYMRKEMTKRNSNITFNIITNDYSRDILDRISDIAFSYDDSYASNEGDYLVANFKRWSSKLQKPADSNCVTITYTVDYLSTYDEEVAVDKEIKNVLDQLNVYNKDEYTKIKAVHDYIVKNISYDNTLHNFSTYNAIIDKNVVCQGFASLTYRMLKELGVGVRYISGMSNGNNHGWNIVRVNNLWYNLDNTWDENIYAETNQMCYDYFLKSNSDFSDHDRASNFITTEFNSKYPMSPYSINVSNPPNQTIKNYSTLRIGGLNRYETSINISEKLFKNNLNNVILASATNFPDALSGSILSAKYDAPILLVDMNLGNNTETLSYIKSNLNSNGKIFLLGGTSVVPENIISTLKSWGFNNFERLGGLDRYDTNLLINNKLTINKGSNIIVANSKSFADSLSISGIAGSEQMPIYLTDANYIESKTLDAIKAVSPSTIYIIGGNSAISSAIENTLRSISSVIRLGGIDRYETSIKIASYFNKNTTTATIASGLNFPDALSGSLLASKLQSPIILVNNNEEPTNQKSYLDSTKISNLYILGGTTAVSDFIKNRLSVPYQLN